MKTLFIEARKKQFPEVNIGELAEKLPQEISLAYSIQYKSLAQKLKKKLEKMGKKVYFVGQILGCSKIQVKGSALVLVSSGQFHAIQLALSTEKPVFVLDSNKIRKISGEETGKLKKRRKTAYSNFLSADIIGVIVSTKIGQENMKEAEEIKKNLERKGKNPFIFLADTISPSELENFSCQSWINVACPGFSLESNKIINLQDISGF